MCKIQYLFRFGEESSPRVKYSVYGVCDLVIRKKI